MRFRDPVQVGAALLVFEFDDEVCLPGWISSTGTPYVGKRKAAASVTDR
jgi:hypothetical protein